MSSIGGASKGTSSNGALHIGGLLAGQIIIDFARQGYVGAKATVTIEAGKTTTAAVKLEPDRSTKEAFGNEVFKRMLAALGGDAAVQEALSIQAEGKARRFSSRVTAYGHACWSIFLRNTPDRALIQATGGGGVLYEVAFTGSQFKTGKNLKGDDARELPTDFGLIRDHQIAGFIALLNTPKFKMMSSVPAKTPGLPLIPDSGGNRHRDDHDQFEDNDLKRPVEVKFGTATGLGAVES